MPHVAGDMSDKTVAHAVKSAAVARRCFFPTRGGALRALAHRPGGYACAHQTMPGYRGARIRAGCCYQRHLKR